MDSISPPNLPSGAPASRSPKVLWGVIGALAVAVAALGGVLLHRQDAGAPPSTVAACPPHRPDRPSRRTTSSLKQCRRRPCRPCHRWLRAPCRKPWLLHLRRRQAPASLPLLLPHPAAPPCAVCGHVESVRPVQKRAQNTTGVGAVAGGVVGGLVGNQFGHGNGRVATTVLGAVGGGFAGNEVEKHVRTVTVYEVAVRMDNGSLRTVETKTAPPIGKPVTLRKGLLRPADGRK
jgi:hypothetical protein